ncbi:type III-A CRISPR-associated protein Csm2 [bacterium]|nr:MAG: type III-A CRISPR-associated protein Csm2 [bacterium]
MRNENFSTIANVRGKITRFSSFKTYPAEEMMKDADRIGREISRTITTTQIRKFLDAVKKLKVKMKKPKPEERKGEESITEFRRNEVLYLKPHIAYAGGRHRNVRPFAELVMEAIDKVHDADDFEQFATFIEAIVAFHKFYGGKD